ncbi:MAG: hypothetical protein ABSB38_03590 [Dehalococcoidia bacterium]|jgi:hypothetical protein
MTIGTTFIPADLADGHSLIAVRCVGHCAEPVLFEGDIVVFDPAAAPKAGDTLFVNELATKKPGLLKFTGSDSLKGQHVYGVAKAINRQL